MKKIEDYLPHYLGCKMQYATHYEPQGATYELDEHNLAEAMKFGDLPLLRPLDTMTEEEARDICLMVHDSEEHLEPDSRISREELGVELETHKGVVKIQTVVRCFVGEIEIDTRGNIFLKDEDEALQLIDNQADIFRYLLSKHFDLFQLIPSNLALNSLTSNKTVHE